MFKKLTLATGLIAAAIGAAHAQQTRAAPATPAVPPITMPAPAAGTPAAGAPSTGMPAQGAPVAGAPLAGANSFTEAQAKTRLETQGFTSVSGLTKDKDGIWRGMATKSGRSSNVSVDYQGNIVER